MTVTIVKASALKSMDITGKSDPYVKVILLINGKKTRKKKNIGATEYVESIVQ